MNRYIKKKCVNGEIVSCNTESNSNGDASENGSQQSLRTNPNHFRGQLGSVESNRDYEKVQKLPFSLQTGSEIAYNHSFWGGAGKPRRGQYVSQ